MGAPRPRHPRLGLRLGVRDLIPGSPRLANVADESLYRTYGPHVLQDGTASHWTREQGQGVFQNASLEHHPRDGSPRLDLSPSVRMVRNSGWGYGPDSHAVWSRMAVSAYGHGIGMGFRCVRDVAT